MTSRYRLGRVIDHLLLRVADFAASRRFYATTSIALGLPFKDGGDHFTIDEIYVDQATDYVSRVHLAFQAKRQEDVALFYKMAAEAGGNPNGGPGYRPYHGQYYAAFVLDPDGNNIEAVCDQPSQRSADSVIVERG